MNTLILALAMLGQTNVDVQAPGVNVHVQAPGYAQPAPAPKYAPYQPYAPVHAVRPVYVPVWPRVVYPIPLQPGDILTRRRIGIFGWRTEPLIIRTRP